MLVNINFIWQEDKQERVRNLVQIKINCREINSIKNELKEIRDLVLELVKKIMRREQINGTDSLETLRSQFNTLAKSQDFGDIANLDSSISSTSIVSGMNELITFVSVEGFFVVMGSSTRRTVGSGQELTY